MSANFAHVINKFGRRGDPTQAKMFNLLKKDDTHQLPGNVMKVLQLSKAVVY